MKTKIALTLAIFLLFVLSCGVEKPENKPVGKEFPRFEGKALSGEEYSSKQFSKGPAVVCFLVSWCLTCGYELVALQEIGDEFAEQKVPIIVFTYEDPAHFSELMDSLEVNLPVIKADSALFAQMFIDAIPTRILLENGHEAMRITGAPSFEDEDFRIRLRKILGLPEGGIEDSGDAGSQK